MHICLEIYDPVTINHITISIPETEEFKEGGLLECTVFLYVIKVLRNDGLEWLVKRRYSQMRSLKGSLSESVREVIKDFNWRFSDVLKGERAGVSKQESVEVYKQAVFKFR